MHLVLIEFKNGFYDPADISKIKDHIVLKRMYSIIYDVKIKNKVF